MKIIIRRDCFECIPPQEKEASEKKLAYLKVIRPNHEILEWLQDWSEIFSF